MDATRYLDINAMDGNYLRYAYFLEIIEENSQSIYAVGMYGTYRINKKNGRLFLDGKLMALSCEYVIY